jgi:Ca2+-binding EF-hand superfamily protein
VAQGSASAASAVATPLPDPALPPLTATKTPAPTAKKRRAAKMPGAKSGFPARLAEQLRDYFVIGLMLAGVWYLGKSNTDSGHGEHGEGGHEDGGGQGHRRALLDEVVGRALNGHHEVDPNLDLQVTLGICVVLISVTIIFELAKHYLEHNVPPLMANILQAMFGELTVLGFIALYAYFMLRLGVLSWFSMKIYDDPEHLIHLFEDIHFMLFFVMLVFLFQACMLVLATLRSEEFFQRTEAMLNAQPPLEKVAPADAAAAPAVSQMLATYKAARQHCCTRICICPRLLWGYREAEAKEELTYSLLRARFIYPPRPETGKAALPPDFDFSCYLRHRMVHEVAHALHVSPATWACIILFLGAILYLPVLETQYAHVQVTVHYVVGLGWFFWLISFSVRAKLGHVMYMLTPPHALLEGAPKSFDEEAPSSALLAQRVEAPPYESLMPLRSGSKHERLFWRGREGPGHLLFLMRLQMLMGSIILAVIYSWLNAKPEDTNYLLLGLLPVLDVMITAPKSTLPMMVMATSVELMKKQTAIGETLIEMQTEKTLKMLKMLNTLQAQAKRIQKMQKMDKKNRPGMPKPKPKEIDPAQEAELRAAFELFDKDGSGSIDKSELKEVLLSLGQDLSESDLQTMYVQMDPSGDGVIDFDEFCDVMAPDETPETPAQVAASVFLMLDSDGSGKITAAELKAAVVKVNTNLTDDDIGAAMELFDKDHTGTITEKEFRQGIELMKTFG